MPAPANDNWANAEVVSIDTDGGTFTSSPVDNLLATKETGEPNPARQRSVWYKYTPTSAGTVTVDLGDSYMTDTATYPFSHYTDTWLAVCTGSAVDALTNIATNDDGADTDGRSKLTFSADAGTTYYIQVNSYGGASPEFDITYITKVTGPSTNIPGQITGVTATATAAAWPAPHPPASVNVDGELATATATAHPATDVRAYEWAARATATAWPAKPPHDDIATAYVLTGSGGSGTLAGLGATREAGEPTGQAGPADADSLWLRYTPTVPGDLTITVPAGLSAEIWDGSDFTDMAYVAGAATIVSAAVAANISYWIRLAPTGVGASMPVTVAFSWAYTERIAELELAVDDTELEDTPTTVRVGLLNGTPGGPVEFSFDGVVIYADVFDAAGVLADVDLTIPETAAGTYTLLATDTTNARYDSVDLTVLEDPLGDPDDTPSTEAPTIDPEVVRWHVEDPYSAVATYTFPINPAEMNTPFAARTLTVEPTTSPDGQPLVWEAGAKPHAWQFSGHIETQAFYEALEGYAASNQRWWLIDHRHRGWLVTFEAFDPTLRTRTDPAAPYRSSYVMRCLTYYGPVTL